MKVLNDDGGETMQRFVLEAQITGQLDHPSVLPVYDLGLDEKGQPFFTMKLVRGHQTLADLIKALRTDDPEVHRRYTFQRRISIVQQVSHALHYAHQRGVVHRDIKPQNIVVGPFGEVYLLDWGIAKLAGAPEEKPEERVRTGDTTTETKDGVLLGTPAYMSPEQVRVEEVDALSDVYCLAVVLYEFLTLHYYLGAVIGGSATGVLTAILKDTPAPAESHYSPTNGRVPRVLSRLLEKALAKERDDRFQSAAEFEGALQEWFEGNAPVVCGGTAMQRVLARWINWVDRHPFVVPIVSFVFFVLFVRWLVIATWEVIQLLLRG
jgi:eukaryotic-like serine/threonine-protein kinase